MSGPARALFVAGAGTDVGKTYVTAALTRRLLAEGRPVVALKPVVSGVPPVDSPGFSESDTGLLLAAQGFSIASETVESCSPWRFAAPLAPDLAAAREGRRMRLDELSAWCRARLGKRQGEIETILIEGVGGLMSPVTEDATGLDWLKALDIPALLVTGSYLGAISHTLTAVETLRAHAIPLAGIVVSESRDAPVSPEIVAETIVRHADTPAIVLHRGGACPDALARLV